MLPPILNHCTGKHRCSHWIKSFIFPKALSLTQNMDTSAARVPFAGAHTLLSGLCAPRGWGPCWAVCASDRQAALCCYTILPGTVGLDGPNWKLPFVGPQIFFTLSKVI